MAEGKHPGGRPRKEIDLAQVAAMCKIQCTQVEICGVLDVSEETLLLRLQEQGWSSFPEFYERHSSEGKMSLRRVQWQNAMGGNATMQIWLGKQVLGQVEKREYTGKDGGPLRTEVTQVEKNIEDMSLEELQAEVHARSAGA